jgi:hypothetical protein
MTTREHHYGTNYWLLAGAWMAVFIGLSFSFNVCGLKGRKEVTVPAMVRVLLKGDYPESEDINRSLSTGCLINATCAAIVAWPFQAISFVALAFVRRSPKSTIST